MYDRQTCVKKIQRALNDAGYKAGAVDGILGKKTKAAFTELAANKFITKPKDVPNKPLWIVEAMKHIGLREYVGQRHNKQILAWWESIRAPFRDDETPWCAGFVGGILEDCGIKSTRSASARSYTKWGKKLQKPIYGCIVVFWRGKRNGWSGHVGFVVGQDRYGNLMVLGGNQGNAVNIKSFAKNRVLSYHWPNTHSIEGNGSNDLPVLASGGVLSTNEA